MGVWTGGFVFALGEGIGVGCMGPAQIAVAGIEVGKNLQRSSSPQSVEPKFSEPIFSRIPQQLSFILAGDVGSYFVQDDIGRS